jgi:hypothetical protein
MATCAVQIFESLLVVYNGDEDEERGVILFS